jgi:hypothetical protein
MSDSMRRGESNMGYSILFVFGSKVHFADISTWELGWILSALEKLFILGDGVQRY